MTDIFYQEPVDVPVDIKSRITYDREDSLRSRNIPLKYSHTSVKRVKQKDTIKSVTKDFGQLTTAHGLGRITDDSHSKWYKILWTIAFLGVTAYFLYSSYKILVDYVEI